MVEQAVLGDALLQGTKEVFETMVFMSLEESCDAMCEVANMVMGCFKSKLADKVGDLDVSIPSVVRGRELENNLGKGASKILVKVNIADEYLGELSLLYRNSPEQPSDKPGVDK